VFIATDRTAARFIVKIKNDEDKVTFKAFDRHLLMTYSDEPGAHQFQL